MAGVVEKWEVEGVNENGEHLVDVCSERGLFLANTFQHKMIHQKSLIDYTAVDERLQKDMHDAKVVRGVS